MTIDERHRIALHEAAKRTFGDDAAVTLMELLPPVGWADVATRRDPSRPRLAPHRPAGRDRRATR